MYVIWLKWVCNIDKITFWRFLTPKKKLGDSKCICFLFFRWKCSKFVWIRRTPESYSRQSVSMISSLILAIYFKIFIISTSILYQYSIPIKEPECWTSVFMSILWNDNFLFTLLLFYLGCLHIIVECFS